MDVIIILAAVLILCYFSVCVRVIVCHPIKATINVVVDGYKYIRYKRWNELETGIIACFIGLFGKGKTLSAVKKVVDIYNKYNDKLIYDFDRKKWVTQKVLVLSNVDLSIPFLPFTSLNQIVQLANSLKEIDILNDTRTCVIVLGDEFSVQLNSRSFKTNIDPMFLNTLLTCRHHYISLYYTAQRFNHVDALLRQVTSYVVECCKKWRIMVHQQYDAYTLENATDPTLVAPVARFGWFIEDKHFNAYDTLACVGNLTKSCIEGDMISESEILSLQQNNPANMDAVATPSRKYVRSMRKRRK